MDRCVDVSVVYLFYWLLPLIVAILGGTCLLCTRWASDRPIIDEVLCIMSLINVKVMCVKTFAARALVFQQVDD
jgi:hypothetical protein